MNIFYLDHDQTTNAQYHVDKHVVKMVLEYAQLLSTAHHILDRITDPRFYKPTHINHPSAVWVRQSFSNYMWLAKMLRELCTEYTYRYGRIHKVESSGLMTLLYNPPAAIPFVKFTQPTPAMPDEFKTGDSVTSYRKYYSGAKQPLATWKNRPIPSWYYAT